MKVLKEYIYGPQYAESKGQNGHHYIFDYDKADEFCPACGRQDLWVEHGGGDYYLGPDYVCAHCGTVSHLESTGKCEDAVLQQLRTGITSTPTTPRGR